MHKNRVFATILAVAILSTSIVPTNLVSMKQVQAEEVTKEITNPSDEYEKENDPLYEKYNSVQGLARAGATSYGEELIHDSKFDDYDKIYGIDVSKYQKTIDWAKVKKSGIKFAIIRLGYRGMSTGDLVLDPYFEDNIKGAHEAGVDVGVYFFTQAITTAEAKEEAKFVTKELKSYKKWMKYPVYIDMEYLAGSRFDAENLSKSKKTSICKAFCKQAVADGYKAGVYSGANYLNTYLTVKDLSDYEIWVARYNTFVNNGTTSSSNYKGNYSMWQYSSKGSVSGITGNVDMDVYYRNPRYYVTFDGNNSSAGTMKKQTYNMHAEYNLPENAFLRTGYYFAGWNTEADGTGTAYEDKEMVKNMTTDGGKTITLYAQWKKIAYMMTYALNGGKNHVDNPEKFYITTPSFKLKNPSRKGYSFKEWYLLSNYLWKIDTVNKGTTSNIKVYAKWQKNKYTITYNLDKGKNSTKNPVKYYVTTPTIKLAKPTRKNYVFKGWYTDKAKTKKITEITKGSTGNKTLYAKWAKKTYAITYKLNGGTNHFDNPAKYKHDAKTFTLQKPKRAGYTFKGWYTDKKFKNKITKIQKGTNKKITVYAKWAKKTYTISYETDGGWGNWMNPTQYTVTTKTIFLEPAVKAGYEFAGWYTDEECTEPITEIKKGTTGNKTLYAKWVLPESEEN